MEMFEYPSRYYLTLKMLLKIRKITYSQIESDNKEGSVESQKDQLKACISWCWKSRPVKAQCIQWYITCKTINWSLKGWIHCIYRRKCKCMAFEKVGELPNGHLFRISNGVHRSSSYRLSGGCFVTGSICNRKKGRSEFLFW